MLEKDILFLKIVILIKTILLIGVILVCLNNILRYVDTNLVILRFTQVKTVLVCLLLCKSFV